MYNKLFSLGGQVILPMFVLMSTKRVQSITLSFVTITVVYHGVERVKKERKRKGKMTNEKRPPHLARSTKLKMQRQNYK